MLSSKYLFHVLSPFCCYLVGFSKIGTKFF
nr:MAG TPA: hypothetical protein [Caudoviricetes sp.]